MFKKGAVKLRYERSSITELASELGILPDRIDTLENIVAMDALFTTNTQWRRTGKVMPVHLSSKTP